MNKIFITIMIDKNTGHAIQILPWSTYEKAVEYKNNYKWERWINIDIEEIDFAKIDNPLPTLKGMIDHIIAKKDAMELLFTTWSDQHSDYKIRLKNALIETYKDSGLLAEIFFGCMDGDTYVKSLKNFTNYLLDIKLPQFKRSDPSKKIKNTKKYKLVFYEISLDTILKFIEHIFQTIDFDYEYLFYALLEDYEPERYEKIYDILDIYEAAKHVYIYGGK